MRSAYLDNVRIKYISLKYHIANYASDTQMSWTDFRYMVNAGYSYEGETVYLDEDITNRVEMVGPDKATS